MHRTSRRTCDCSIPTQLSGKSAKRRRKELAALDKSPQQGRDPREQQQNAGQQQFVQATLQQFSGPLPLPAMLQGYEDIVPGSAERILALAESEAEHRRALERSFVTYRAWGLAIAAIIGVGGLASGVFLTVIGKSVAGLTVLITELAILAAAFIAHQFRS